MPSVQTKHMTNPKIDLNAIMADYTDRYNKMQARSAANRQAFAEGRPAPFPAAAPTSNWNISDRD